MPKKQFKETKLGKFLDKAKGVVPEIADVGLDILTGTSPLKALGSKLKEVAGNKAPELIEEFNQFEAEFQKEIVSLVIEDKKNARAREIEVTKLGKFDLMFYLVGMTGMGVFGFFVYAMFFIDIPGENRELIIHLAGIIEGVVVSIFAYYFGTSKSSNEKTKLLSRPDIP